MGQNTYLSCLVVGHQLWLTLYLLHCVSLVFWWSGAQASVGWSNGRRGSEVEGHLWVQLWLPCRGCGLWGCVWHLPAHTCKNSTKLFKTTVFCPVTHRWTWTISSPPQIQTSIQCHAIIILPNTDGIELLVCYEDEGVYVNTYGRITKDVVLQWGEMPTSVGTYLRQDATVQYGSWQKKKKRFLFDWLSFTTVTSVSTLRLFSLH